MKHIKIIYIVVIVYRRRKKNVLIIKKDVVACESSGMQISYMEERVTGFNLTLNTRVNENSQK